MTVHIFSRPESAALECWGCTVRFLIKVDPGLRESDIIWDLLIRARREGWIAHRYADEVFALCPSCVNADLARLLRSLYDSHREPGAAHGSRSARGPAGAGSPAGLWRRIRSILKIREEVRDGQEPEPVVWD